MDSPLENFPENDSSGVNVIDKVALVMSALESRPTTLAQFASTTHLAHPTARYIAVALELHRLVIRDSQGRFILGPRPTKLASTAGEDHLLSAVGSVLATLRDRTHESAQPYRRQGGMRICVVNAECPIGLRDSIPVNATMSMQGGSAVQMLLAREEPDCLYRGPVGARPTATMLPTVRRRGWVQSVEGREPGVVSVSASVCGPGGKVAATISTSRPTERMERQPGRAYGHMVIAAARRLPEVFADINTV